jgi:hypothetical protein
MVENQRGEIYMEVIRVTENWQRAAVYWLRIQVFVEGQSIPLETEIDAHDGMPPVMC